MQLLSAPQTAGIFKLFFLLAVFLVQFLSTMKTSHTKTLSLLSKFWLWLQLGSKKTTTHKQQRKLALWMLYDSALDMILSLWMVITSLFFFLWQTQEDWSLVTKPTVYMISSCGLRLTWALFNSASTLGGKRSDFPVISTNISTSSWTSAVVEHTV